MLNPQVHADSSNFAAGVSKQDAYGQIIEQAKALFDGQRNWVCHRVVHYGMDYADHCCRYGKGFHRHPSRLHLLTTRQQHSERCLTNMARSARSAITEQSGELGRVLRP